MLFPIMPTCLLVLYLPCPLLCSVRLGIAIADYRPSAFGGRLAATSPTLPSNKDFSSLDTSINQLVQNCDHNLTQHSRRVLKTIRRQFAFPQQQPTALSQSKPLVSGKHPMLNHLRSTTGLRASIVSTTNVNL